jgi:hypothetical protein
MNEAFIYFMLVCNSKIMVGIRLKQWLCYISATCAHMIMICVYLLCENAK